MQQILLQKTRNMFNLSYNLILKYMTAHFEGILNSNLTKNHWHRQYLKKNLKNPVNKN